MSFQKLLKSLSVTAVAIYLTSLAVPGFVIQPGLNHLLTATLTLVVLNIFVKPLIKLLLLPVNLLTLGAFRWLINIMLIYLLSLLLPSVTLRSFSLSQLPGLGSILPDILVGQFFVTILVSLVFSLCHHLLFWLIK